MEQTPIRDAALRLLDGLCAAWLDIQQGQSPEAFCGRGTVIPESQVTAALSGQTTAEPCPGFLEQLNILRQTLADGDNALCRLVRTLAPTDFPLLCLLLSAAPLWNRKYQRVFAYLQDNVAETAPSVGLAADLFSLIAPLPDAALYAVNDPAAPLNRFVLRSDGGDGLDRALRLRRSAEGFLTDSPTPPKELLTFCQVFWEAEPPLPLVGQEIAARAARLFAYTLRESGGASSVLEVCGAEGAGRRFSLRHAAAKAGVPLLCVEAQALWSLPDSRREEALEDMLSWCWLYGGVPALLTDALAEAESPVVLTAAVSHLTRAAAESLPMCAVVSRSPLPLDGVSRLFRLELPTPTLGEQRILWEAFLGSQSLPVHEDVAPQTLAGVYVLTPGQMRRALHAAEGACIAAGATCLTRAAVAQGVQQLCRARMSRLAEPMASSFTWEDLKLEQPQLTLLYQLRDRIRCRWQVNELWGFDRKLPYGRGVSVCLYGPPGTGKTMTAQVLAREFGLDAYRVDMSRIMDKYVGETEKKLAELFDAARDSNAILFFDEADALFSKRTDVKESNDKYANAETAYLLQRMEQHRGISILATNAAQNFDEAFKRRISFMIQLPMPSVAIRKALWQSVFPAEAPLEDFDPDFLAQRFELSGSSIKNVAVSAAFLAASQSRPIDRELIRQAVREEYLKTGRVLMEHQLY